MTSPPSFARHEINIFMTPRLSEAATSWHRALPFRIEGGGLSDGSSSRDDEDDVFSHAACKVVRKVLNTVVGAAAAAAGL